MHMAANSCVLNQLPVRVRILRNLRCATPQGKRVLHIVADYGCLHHVPALAPENIVKMSPIQRGVWLECIGHYPIPAVIKQLLKIEIALSPVGDWAT